MKVVPPSGTQCPECGAPVDVTESRLESDEVMAALEPCGHEVSPYDLFGVERP